MEGANRTVPGRGRADGGSARAEYEKNLALLRTKQEEAWENFHKLTNAGDGAPWEQFRANMDKASGELKAAGERMTSQFKV